MSEIELMHTIGHQGPEIGKITWELPPEVERVLFDPIFARDLADMREHIQFLFACQATLLTRSLLKGVKAGNAAEFQSALKRSQELALQIMKEQGLR